MYIQGETLINLSYLIQILVICVLTFNMHNLVPEDEYHVVMDCRIYDDICDRLFTEIGDIYFKLCNLTLDSRFL